MDSHSAYGGFCHELESVGFCVKLDRIATPERIRRNSRYAVRGFKMNTQAMIGAGAFVLVVNTLLGVIFGNHAPDPCERLKNCTSIEEVKK